MRFIAGIVLTLSVFPLLARADSSIDYCAGNSELACISSPHCTLHLGKEANSGYACKAAANTCEQGFIQESGTPAECEAKRGCTFAPHSCYCPPNLLCRCGGGAPSQCQPSS